MSKFLALTALLCLCAAGARADLLEVSGFGGYTTVGMKDVNTTLSNFSTDGVYGIALPAGVAVDSTGLSITEVVERVWEAGRSRGLWREE